MKLSGLKNRPDRMLDNGVFDEVSYLIDFGCGKGHVSFYLAYRYFPFGSVGNGDYFCFDLKTGRVVLYAHEQNTFYNICDSYTEFMNRLVVK